MKPPASVTSPEFTADSDFGHADARGVRISAGPVITLTGTVSADRVISLSTSASSGFVIDSNVILHSVVSPFSTETPLPSRQILLRSSSSVLSWSSVSMSSNIHSGIFTTRNHATTAGELPAIDFAALSNSTPDNSLQTLRLRQSFSSALALASDEWFEDGVESRFSRDLSLLLSKYGPDALEIVERFLSSPTTSNIEAAVEALHWLGALDHPPSLVHRRRVLESMLYSKSARMRHAAVSGLATMDDPAALTLLTAAQAREDNPIVRRCFELLIEQLQDRTWPC